MKNSEPAFPICDASNMHPVLDKDNNLIGHTVVNLHRNGMSLRDYFAAKAMQGVLANSTFNLLDDDLEQMSNKFYKLADAMLEAREK